MNGKSSATKRKKFSLSTNDPVAQKQKSKGQQTKSKTKGAVFMESEVKGMRTVYELEKRLKQYPKKLTATIYDTELGDAPIAFKRESAEKNGQTFKWITIFPSEEPHQTTVEAILGILEKCPKQMFISIRDRNGNYSDLYTSIESMVGDFTDTKWLVVSDKVSYFELFAEKDPTNKETAIEKMTTELGKDPDSTQRLIFGWLKRQNDDLLFTGILKNDRTLKQSVTFAMGKAKALANQGNVAIVDDETVFSWIYEYFTADKVDVPKVNGTVGTGKKKATKKPKTKTDSTTKKEVVETVSEGGEEQVSLF